MAEYEDSNFSQLYVILVIGLLFGLEMEKNEMFEMRKRVMTVVSLILVLVLLVGWRFIPGTYHFSGEGEHFGAGVNTTVGISFKYLELVIRSKPPREMTNIKYELEGRFGLKSSGVVSLGSDGYYRDSIREGNSPMNISRFDVITLTLEWNNQTEVFKLRNTD